MCGGLREWGVWDVWRVEGVGCVHWFSLYSPPLPTLSQRSPHPFNAHIPR